MRTTKIILSVLMLIIAGCGIKVSSEPVKVEGTVIHKVEIDTVELVSFFTSYCKAKPDVDSEAKLDACVNSQIALFWQAAVNSMPPAGAQQ